MASIGPPVSRNRRPPSVRSGRHEEGYMARMKFLCDADRCIDCNACVTACKNENEVPWGINRRRVVTLNDGLPGELHLSHRRRGGVAFEGSVHRLWLLFLCMPIRRAAISAHRQLRFARQNGQM